MGSGWITFLRRVGPHLLGFGRALFKHFRGDADAAIGAIKDRRDEIDRLRRQNDVALAKKHRG